MSHVQGGVKLQFSAIFPEHGTAWRSNIAIVGGTIGPIVARRR